MKIREIKPRDFSRVLEIARLSFPDELERWQFNTVRAWILFGFYGLRLFFQKFRKTPGFKFYVAETNQKVVAGTVAQWQRGFVYLTAVMVHPEFRRQGIGRRIVTHAVHEAFQLGAKKVVLHVRSDNLPALRLYQSLGFRPFEERIIMVWEGKAGCVERAWPPGFRLVRTSHWDQRVWEIRAKCFAPEAARVYGPPEVPRTRVPFLLRRLIPLSKKTWLVLDTSGRAVAELSISYGNLGQIVVNILPEYRGLGLEEALLCFGLSKARGKKIVMRTNSNNVQLIDAALGIGFRQKIREIGMVYEKVA